jgi:C4-dicarboxylate-specific signal transduction histidine kinase
MHRILITILICALVPKYVIAMKECDAIKDERRAKIFELSHIDMNETLKDMQDINKLLTQTPEQKKQAQSPEIRAKRDAINARIDELDKLLKAKKCEASS